MYKKILKNLSVAFRHFIACKVVTSGRIVFYLVLDLVETVSDLIQRFTQPRLDHVEFLSYQRQPAQKVVEIFIYLGHTSSYLEHLEFQLIVKYNASFLDPIHCQKKSTDYKLIQPAQYAEENRVTCLQVWYFYILI